MASRSIIKSSAEHILSPDLFFSGGLEEYVCVSNYLSKEVFDAAAMDQSAVPLIGLTWNRVKSVLIDTDGCHNFIFVSAFDE